MYAYCKRNVWLAKTQKVIFIGPSTRAPWVLLICLEPPPPFDLIFPTKNILYCGFLLVDDVFYYLIKGNNKLILSGVAQLKK